VTVTLSGLPTGVTISSSSPLTIQPGDSQAITFLASATAPTGVFPLNVSGASESISHTTQILLTSEPVVTAHTYQSGSMLFLESDSGTDVARIGLNLLWGGSIVEVSLNGTNFVNEDGTGREVQAAQWDGAAQYDNCAGCTGVFGWNPVQAGDKWNNGSPVLAQTEAADSICVKTQPLQWNPDDKGGGPNTPVLGDTYVEQTASSVTSHAFSFKVHYKVTHFGTDQHANALQEFPAVYVNLGYNQFLTDMSTSQWMNSVLTPVTMPFLPNFGPTLYSSEHWGAFVDGNGDGLTIFVPGMSNYVGGFAAAGDPGPFGFGTNYFNPHTNFSFGPNSVLEGDVYLVAGDVTHARQVIYDLHNNIPAVDISTPVTTLDAPIPNQQLSGTFTVAGWAIDESAVAKVDVYVDGTLTGTATYGIPRPDVAQGWPNASQNVGFTFALNTATFPNGNHTIQIRATDTTGNVAVLPDVPVTIQN
jgi:Bacterial Ig domain